MNVHCRTLPGISSYLTCQSKFRDTFPDSPVPNKCTVSRLVNRFRNTGSVQDENRSDRPSVFSDDSLVDIRQTLLRSPRKSLRKLSLHSGLSNGSAHKANGTRVRNGLRDFSITLCIQREDGNCNVWQNAGKPSTFDAVYPRKPKFSVDSSHDYKLTQNMRKLLKWK
jgi:hypothetical protein